MWRALTDKLGPIRGKNYASLLSDEDMSLIYILRVFSSSLFVKAAWLEKMNNKEVTVLYAMKLGMRAPWENLIWEHFMD